MIDLLTKKFIELSENDATMAYQKMIDLQMKYPTGRFSNEKEVRDYIDNVMSKLLDDSYRSRFRKVMNSIDDYGLALKTSFTKNLKKEMKYQMWIYNHFHRSNKRNEMNRTGATRALQNARGLLRNMPNNTMINL